MPARHEWADGEALDGPRSDVLVLLAQRAACTRDVAEALGVHESTARYHLHLLWKRRLVREKRSGRCVWWSLAREDAPQAPASVASAPRSERRTRQPVNRVAAYLKSRGLA